ncbi:MarR family transcriptional regulator [Paracoccus sp. S-4012]|uniref:MarR family winged helix-turn-helix transcriptional regulator n=1 Tax=Paracoccus sp. S-4012 TaxID=2665648 RepID=UPI0012AF49D0|nr:MarR family transcriptional regulator [Paracoccus sp. S-4012]MRX51004.1 MarR family transcriptional regulator [Paracoccus sp. S-4012]
MDGPGNSEARESLTKRRLRLWLRMLTVTRATEAGLRGYLREQHGTTLPRFDVMAALWRRGEAIPMGELSRMLLVSNGNATDVVGRLEKEGLVQRTPCTEDRRTVRVTLTEAGRAQFEGMASGHEAELSRLFGALNLDDLETMRAILRKVSPQMDGAKEKA